MKQYRAEEVFSDTILGWNKDPHVFYRIIYTCPQCGYKLSFKENDFYRYSLNKESKYKDCFQGTSVGEFESLLEFECPKCKSKTRVIFIEENGWKEPYYKIKSVIIEK